MSAGFGIKLQINWIKRFLTRIGLFQQNIRNGDILCFHKQNIFENETTGELSRVQVRFVRDEIGIVSLFIDSKLSHCWPRFVLTRDQDNAFSAGDCWEKLNPTFSLYIWKQNWLCYVSRRPNEHRCISEFLEDYVLSKSILRFENRDYVILSWFDRPDRMTFSNYLCHQNYLGNSELYNSRDAVSLQTGRTQFLYRARSVELVVYIHQYL
jgi:hypothetical protein